jgi:hypothetical protein
VLCIGSLLVLPLWAMTVVKLQLLLRLEHRTQQGAATAAAAAQALGLKITSIGAASISAEAEPSLFSALFGPSPSDVAARGAGGTDFGAPAGFSLQGEPTVPPALTELVEGVSVPEPYVRFI